MPLFTPADILLPKCDLSKWSVIACDQYTAEPDYWMETEQVVGDAPSSLRLILPEATLSTKPDDLDIMEANNTMSQYLRDGILETHPNAMVYIERKLNNGKIRRGILGKIDLQDYDYHEHASSPIRATEGTVAARIPPRVAVRKNAPCEFPHVMLLADDVQNLIFDEIDTAHLPLLYDFPLMQEGGSIKGWLLSEQHVAKVMKGVDTLADPEFFCSRYQLTEGTPPLPFAVGDGNHSLATAKECYERQKKFLTPDQWDQIPARYALVELVNLHDPGLDFAPIHRLLFNIDPEKFLMDFKRFLNQLPSSPHSAQSFYFTYGGISGHFDCKNPTHTLAVSTLQAFLDQWIERHTSASIDYIHGDESLVALSKKPNCLGIFLPSLKKDELFPTVIAKGPLPRKSFSMGDANDKRFYLEGRKIRS
ncbi:MAG: DUF1015 domain-containing protein [Eubacteriales bacterium]